MIVAGIGVASGVGALAGVAVGGTLAAQVQDFYKGVRGEDPSTAPGEALAAVLASVVDLADSDLLASLNLDLDPVLTALELPSQPEMLVEQINN